MTNIWKFREIYIISIKKPVYMMQNRHSSRFKKYHCYCSHNFWKVTAFFSWKWKCCSYEDWQETVTDPHVILLGFTQNWLDKLKRFSQHIESNSPTHTSIHNFFHFLLQKVTVPHIILGLPQVSHILSPSSPLIPVPTLSHNSQVLLQWNNIAYQF